MRNVLDSIDTETWSRHANQIANAMIDIADASEEPMSVLEIGTAYGNQLPFYCEHYKRVVCVDPMYSWVPDLKPGSEFEPARIDPRKVHNWTKNAGDACELVIGSSFEVHDDPDWLHVFMPGFDVIIVDGCHHPKEAISGDYLNFLPYMEFPHYVIFDDVQWRDVRLGAEDALSGMEHEKITKKWNNVEFTVAFVTGRRDVS